MSNPWLQIPLRDYEGHMAHAAVAQAQMLSTVLREAVAEFQPRSLAILGVAGGNGLETVDSALVRRVVALDLNPEYLAACTERHAHRFAQYEAVLHDLRSSAPSFEPVDLVFAGLLLEYLGGHTFLDQLPSLLSARGVFVTLLQLSSAELPTVSRSPFAGMGQLESVFHFVDPATVRNELIRRGFLCRSEKGIRLASGKEFHHAVFHPNCAASDLPHNAQTGAKSRSSEPGGNSGTESIPSRT